MSSLSTPAQDGMNHDIPRWKDIRASRRLWLALEAMDGGADPHGASQAVLAAQLAHPEWDMDAERTLEEWSHARP
jgi:hypothetical protein